MLRLEYNTAKEVDLSQYENISINSLEDLECLFCDTEGDESDFDNAVSELCKGGFDPIFIIGSKCESPEDIAKKLAISTQKYHDDTNVSIMFDTISATKISSVVQAYVDEIEESYHDICGDVSDFYGLNGIINETYDNYHQLCEEDHMKNYQCRD